MPDASLVARVAESIRAVSKIPASVPISAESRLVEDLAIDSLDFVGIVLRIQDDFGVEIDDDEVPNLRTVGLFATYIDAHSGAAA